MRLTIHFLGLCMFVTRQKNPGPGDRVRVLLPDTTSRLRHRDDTPAKLHNAAVVLKSGAGYIEHCRLKDARMSFAGASTLAAAPDKAALDDLDAGTAGLGTVINVSDHTSCLTPCVGAECGTDDPEPLGRIAAELVLEGGRWFTKDAQLPHREWVVRPHLKPTPGPHARGTVAERVSWTGDFSGPITMVIPNGTDLDITQSTEIWITNTDVLPVVAPTITERQGGNEVEDPDFKWYYSILRHMRGEPIRQLPIPVATTRAGVAIEKAGGIIGADVPTCLECLVDPEVECPE